MKVSIIVPVKENNDNLRECVNRCLELDYPDFEVVILPDNLIKDLDGPKVNHVRSKLSETTASPLAGISNVVKTIPTGSISPPEKRNKGITNSDGPILAFIDDDAFPTRDWLKNAIKHFEDGETAAVGGPAVTPQSDSLRQKASGLVYSSLIGGGKYAYRYLPQRPREVDDYPSCNFIVRRSVLEEIGGFKTNFWPGEDTALCLEITKKLGKKIIYDPEVLIYHHRRPLFIPHLRQVSSYALHRGYFAKKFPQTSLRFSYLAPSLFVIGLIAGGSLSFISPIIKSIYITLIAIYLLLAFLSSLNRDIRLIPLTFLGIILTHLCYGIWFIKGLASRKLKEEK